MTDPVAATAQIEATLAALPADQRAALEALRRTIAAAAPDAEEAISYSMPAFRYHGRSLVAYAAFKAHCSLFPMSAALIEAHREAFAGFATAKGTLRFTPEHPLPDELVRLIVRERMAQIDARGGSR
ncbi:MAG: iron chaperone [Candidatus Limnocylindrales bacterium]